MLPDSVFDNVLPEDVYLKTSIIEYLDVSKRIKIILYKTPYRTMFDLDSRSDQSLLAYEGIGKVSCVQIRRALQKIRTQIFQKERELGLV